MIPFDVPDKFAKQLAEGLLYRVGSTLRDAKTGQIVGFLQETEFFSNVLGDFVIDSLGNFTGEPVSTILLSLGKVALSIDKNRQLRKINKSLETLQVLQQAGIAVSVVGVGISVVGFAMVAKKLNRIEKNIAKLSEDVSDIAKNLQSLSNKIESRDSANLQSLLYRADEAKLRSDIKRVYQNLADELDKEERYYRSQIYAASSDKKGSKSGNPFLLLEKPLVEITTLLDIQMTLSSQRIQSLLLLNHLDAAIFYANNVAEWTQELLAQLNPIVLMKSYVVKDNKPKGIARHSKMEIASFVNSLREMELQILSRPLLLEMLKEKGISATDYISEFQNLDKNTGNEREPIMVLMK